MNPFLYGLVSLIWLITQLSGAPNPARSPVSGWIHPIVIDLPLDALAVLPPAEAPLMLELQASSRLPPPTTAAPTPAARNRPRRETPPPSGVPGLG